MMLKVSAQQRTLSIEYTDTPWDERKLLPATLQKSGQHLEFTKKLQELNIKKIKVSINKWANEMKYNLKRKHTKSP